MEATIRPWTLDDAAASRRLWIELTQHHRDIYDAQDIGGDDPGAGFDAYISRNDRVATWVAEENGEVVGMCGLLVSARECEVEPVIVASSRRGTGIGAALVTVALDEARRRGMWSVSVRPVARNADAVAFFHEIGFRTIGHVELFMTLQPGRTWDEGVELHGREFRI